MEKDMKDLKGKTAFITGGGSGIGQALARCFAREGMNIVVAARDRAKLDETVAEVEALGARALAIELNVLDLAAFQGAADKAESVFGPVHILCNNAGVSLSGKAVVDLTPEDWNWVLSVNINGPVNGILTFLPRMLKHGEPSHINFTSSGLGIRVTPAMKSAVYSASKYAVTGIAESMENELAGTNVGVSVSSPAMVRTKIYESSLRRDAQFGTAGAPQDLDKVRAAFEKNGLDPDEFARRVLAGIREGALYVMTHGTLRPDVEKRCGRLMQAFDHLAELKAQEG